MNPSTTTLAIGGHLQAPSGAALIHEQLAVELAREMPEGTAFLGGTPVGGTSPSMWTRLASRLPAADIVVWTSTPLPLRVPAGARVVPVIYDLRWLQTRAIPGKVYRAVDLARTLKRAEELFTISQTVASQLGAITSKLVHVLPLGPGQFEGYPAPPPANTKVIVLMGGAPHKRNELAAELLVGSAYVVEHYRVLTVRVSDECSRILEAGMPAGTVTTHALLSERELAAVLELASVFVSLGKDEGFGFPYVEASYFGCDVVAPDVPITREVLEPRSPTLLGEVTSESVERALRAWDEDRIRAVQLRALSLRWRDVGDVVRGRTLDLH